MLLPLLTLLPRALLGPSQALLTQVPASSCTLFP